MGLGPGSGLGSAFGRFLYGTANVFLVLRRAVLYRLDVVFECV